ncbi:MAG: hypothetical protein KY459_03215 [Acidobacteria bacterium]|nr:hypothetical protein [Acidobacteriota bacterium]
MASALGDAAIVVWEQEGDLVGRLIEQSGSPGPVTALASSPLPETSPQLVVVEGTTYLLYERIDEEAGGVPRIFMRSLFLNDRRPAVRRR